MLSLLFFVTIFFFMLRPRPAHAFWESIVTSLAGGLVTSLFGKDDAQPPTQQDIETAVQKAITPELIKAAANQGVMLDKIVAKEVAKQGLWKRYQTNNKIFNLELKNAAEFAGGNMGREYENLKNIVPDLDKRYSDYLNSRKKSPDMYRGTGFKEYLMQQVPGIENEYESYTHNKFENIDKVMEGAKQYDRYASFLDAMPELKDPTLWQDTPERTWRDPNTGNWMKEKGRSWDTKANELLKSKEAMFMPEDSKSAKAVASKIEEDPLYKTLPNDIKAAVDKAMKTSDKALALTESTIVDNAALFADDRARTLDAIAKLEESGKATPDQLRIRDEIKNQLEIGRGGEAFQRMVKQQMDALNAGAVEARAAVGREYAGRGINLGSAAVTEGIVPLEMKYAEQKQNIINDSMVNAMKIYDEAIKNGMSFEAAIQQASLQSAAGVVTALQNLDAARDQFTKTQLGGANQMAQIGGLRQTQQLAGTNALAELAKIGEARQMTNITLQNAFEAQEAAKKQQIIDNLNALYGGQGGTSALLGQSAMKGYEQAQSSIDKYNANLKDTVAGIASAITGLNKGGSGQTTATPNAINIQNYIPERYEGLTTNLKLKS